MSDKIVILIVEDQKGFRHIYEDVLTQDGYGVLTAEDGEKGWELAKDKKPDLILLDLGLPKMDGFEVLQRIRADAGTKAIPVIIFSVMGEQKDVKRALDMGANDYAVKGFYTPRQVLSKIKALMTQLEKAPEIASLKIQVREGIEDAVRLREGVGLAGSYKCPECGLEVVLELFPDFVKEGGHWFSARLKCPGCAKVF